MTVCDTQSIEALATRQRYSAGTRLCFRLLVLSLIALVTYYLQMGYEENGQFWLFVTEILIYAVFLIVFLSRQTGRLKAGPDTTRATYERLAEEDPALKVYIALYMFLLMAAIVARVLFVGAIEDVWMGPWGLFIAIAPIFAIVFWRQYRLEARFESG